MRSVLAALVALLFAQTAAASMNDSKFALHRKNKFSATKTIPSLCDNPSTPAIEPNYSPSYENLPCDMYTVTGPLQASTVYIVIADAGQEGVSAASFGIDYSGTPGSGIDPNFVSFSACADGLMFPNDGGQGEFPKPKGGVRITWTLPNSCARQIIGSHGVHAVVGSFYVYAYSADVLKVTPNNNLEIGPELAVADCAGRTTDLADLYSGAVLENIMGKVGFGSGASSAHNPCGPAIPAPIGHWAFDEATSGSGDGIAYDAFPNQRHGAINGARYVPGVVGPGALEFDGSGDFVGILGSGSPLQLVNTDYTISWWAKPDHLGGIQKLIEMDDGLDNSGGYSAFIQDEFLKLAHNNGQNNTQAFENLSPCGWQHMAVSYSSTVGYRYFYVNAALADSIPVLGGGLTTDGNDQLYFGAHPGGSQFFRGALDDVRLYDQYFSATQVALILQGVPTPGPTLSRATGRDHSTELTVVFTIPVGTGASDPANYSVFMTQFPSSTIPVLAVSAQDSVATLTLASSLNLPKAYTVSVRNVENLCGVPVAPNTAAPIQLLDVNPPRLLFVSGYAGLDTVRVTFSEPVGSGANDPANYAINPLGQPNDLIPVNAALVDGSHVVLLLQSPLGISGYTLKVSNIEDLVGNVIPPNSRISIVPAAPLLGEFTSNLKLTKAYPGPRYHVLGDVHIAGGSTWTLEPGVIVTFTPNEDAANLGDYEAHSEILCEGRMIAVGTDQDSIRFQSDGTGQSGDWGHIKLMGAGQAVFAYCAMRHGHSGVVVLPGASVNLTHSLIQTQSMDGCINSGVLTVSDCSIAGTGQRGVFSTQGRLSIVNTTFHRTTMEGVRQEGGFGNLDFLTLQSVGNHGMAGPKHSGIHSEGSATAIRWNQIQNAGLDGIVVVGDVERGPITGNRISGAGGAGIHLVDATGDSIRFCDIDHCMGAGILLENPGAGTLVENCLIEAAGDGIKSSGGTNLSVRYTTIVACSGSALNQVASSDMVLSVRSSILVSNSGWGIRDLAGSTDDDIRFVDCWNNGLGSYSGTVCDSICMASNPLFANQTGGDYRLLDTSPLRFMGENMTQMGRYGPDQTDVVGIIDDEDPSGLRLPLSSYPNPFARSTTIAFSAESAGEGAIEVFSVTGRLVRNEHIEVTAGINQIAFERRDMASGLYFYRVSWPGHHLTAKMILVP